MPTINQLPTATTVTGADIIPLSQNGLTRSVTVGTLLNSTQPLLSITQDSLLGRSSAGTGGPEALRLGSGLMLLGTAVTANGQDHLGFTQTATLLSTDEIIINSSAVPKRVTASSVRSLFSAGSGVTIDQSGTISITSGSNGAGSPGPKGDTGATGQGFNFRGSFQPNTSYLAYDVIVSGGQTYVATSAFVSAASFDASRWTLIAAQGTAGANGAQGAVGPQGPAGPNLPATTSSIGAVKPGAGLSVASDGTLSIGSVTLATLAQGGAATGQVLGWSGTGWGPTLAGAAGVSSFNNRNGTVTLSLGDVTAVLGTGQVARVNLGLSPIASSGAYADLSGVPVVPLAATTVPAMDGAAATGSANSYARADHVHPIDTSRLAAASNLSDLASGAAARANLGLGGAATLNIGTTAGTVAAGNDSRLATALQASAIPAASSQLLGGSGTAGTAASVLIGSGLSLSGGTLTVTAGSSYTLPPASTTSLGGVKPDGSTVTTASDGTLTVAGVSTNALVDVASLGGPALSDVDVLNRAGADYKVTLSARSTLFRKTPAGSRTVTLSSSITTATLTATDHDKTIVVTGAAAGSLAVDGTITDGFRCQVINHTGSTLSYSGITGLQGATSLPNNTSCWVLLSNATVEATASSAVSTTVVGGASGQLQYNNGGILGGVTLGNGLSLSGSTLSAAGSSAATTTSLGTIKSDGTTVSVAGDGTLSVVGVAISSLSDISTVSGPLLSDIDVINRNGTDYKTSLSARGVLYRKTPAGSRTIALTTGATTATLTSNDHDKTVVVTGSTAGTLTADGSMTDGFRCQVINHTGSALSYSGITGLQSTSSLPNNTSCWVSLSNATLEASAPAATNASSSALPVATSSVLGGVKQGGGVAIAADGTLSVPAYMTAGVAGVVGSLPGGAGATLFRYVFVRPCTFTANLASPYPPQAQASTAPSGNANFTLARRVASGTQTSFGTITITPNGTVSASSTTASFAAGDELVVIAPNPADATLADVSITFTGNWG